MGIVTIININKMSIDQITKDIIAELEKVAKELNTDFYIVLKEAINLGFFKKD